MPVTETAQKTIAKKLAKSYVSAGFKPLFKGSDHLFLTHFRHSSATQLIDNLHLLTTDTLDEHG